MYNWSPLESLPRGPRSRSMHDRRHVSGAPRVALKEIARVTRDKRVPLWPYHRERLRQGGCSDETLKRLDDSIALAMATYDGRLTTRVQLSAIVLADGTPVTSVQRRLSSLDVPGGLKGVAVPVEEPPVLPSGGAKPLDRSYWDHAQRRAFEQRAQQAIIVDDCNTVYDGGSSTIFCRYGNELLTAPTPHAIAGVGRAYVIEHAAQWGLSVRVRPYSFRQLEQADEVFFVNSYGGARIMIGKAGPTCEMIDAHFKALWGSQVEELF